MKHPISITVLNNAVGIAPSEDGIMGIFIRAVAVGSTFVLNTPYLLTQLADLEALGVNAAYDVTNNTAVYQQVSEFYAQAGTGALLWIIGVPQNTNFATYVAGSTFATMIRSTAINSFINRVKMIGLCYDAPQALNTSGDFGVDVIATITALQTAQQQLFNQGYQFSAIIDGNNMNQTTTASNLGDLSQYTAYSVSVCITGTQPNGVSAVGLALGRFARISIGHGFGAVEDGPVDTPTAYLTNAISVVAGGTLVVGDVCTVFGGAITYNSVTYPVGSVFTVVSGHLTFTTSAGGYVGVNVSAVQNIQPTDIDQLGLKQYMFLRTWLNHSGFYWNDGATAESSVLQLSTQEYNRVANALSADALSFFIDQMGKNLPLDKKTGNVDQGYLNSKQAEFYTTYISPLTVDAGSGDITDGELIMTGPNFNSTKTMQFTIIIVPTPILGSVTGVVEFASTL
jgi:hypothetical protein